MSGNGPLLSVLFAAPLPQQTRMRRYLFCTCVSAEPRCSLPSLAMYVLCLLRPGMTKKALKRKFVLL